MVFTSPLGRGGKHSQCWSAQQGPNRCRSRNRGTAQDLGRRTIWPHLHRRRQAKLPLLLSGGQTSREKGGRYCESYPLFLIWLETELHVVSGNCLYFLLFKPQRHVWGLVVSARLRRAGWISFLILPTLHTFLLAYFLEGIITDACLYIS